MHFDGVGKPYFNPRSRTGSDRRWRVYLTTYQISTHAPAQGATRPQSSEKAPFPFQPTLPHRERPADSAGILQRNPVSTHAPAQGATLAELRRRTPSEHFNPRSRTGSDKIRWAWRKCVKHFNPRSRTGSDLGLTYPGIRCNSDFNPRSRTGSDPPMRRSARSSTAISTHAPAQGATLAGSAGGGRPVFQPTLPHRERREPGYTTDGSNGISTHAPAQGATSATGTTVTYSGDFNPRSRTGSDRGDKSRCPPQIDFNPRSRTGSDPSRGAPFAA